MLLCPIPDHLSFEQASVVAMYVLRLATWGIWTDEVERILRVTLGSSTGVKRKKVCPEISLDLQYTQAEPYR